jgi:type 1 glutamine amidotransferase
LDELREGEFQRDAIHVVASAERHPAVYWKQAGRGRVIYVAPGHDRRTLAHPAYLRLIENAVNWLVPAAPQRKE